MYLAGFVARRAARDHLAARVQGDVIDGQRGAVRHPVGDVVASGEGLHVWERVLALAVPPFVREDDLFAPEQGLEHGGKLDVRLVYDDLGHPPVLHRSRVGVLPRADDLQLKVLVVRPVLERYVLLSRARQMREYLVLHHLAHEKLAIL